MRMIIALMILMSILLCSWASAFDNSDLIFYFPFESFDGKTALDQSGKNHNGTINGDIKIVDNGKFGKAAKFATTSFIDMNGPKIPPEQIPRDEITLCAWVNCQNTGSDHAIFNARAADSTWIIHPELKSGGTFRWLLRSDGSAGIFDIQTGAVTWNQWLHYAGTYNGKVGILYINGAEIGRMSASSKIAKDWGSGARIGYNIDNARPFTGLMDELNLWKRALTLEEITNIMNNGLESVFAVSPAGNLITTWAKLKSFGSSD